MSIRLPVLSRVREQSRLEPRTGPRFHLIPGRRRDCAIGRTVVLAWLSSFLKNADKRRRKSIRFDELSTTGHSVVVIERNPTCAGLSLADRLRPGVREVLAATRALGVPHVVMLTGDNEGTAAVTKQASGIDEVHAELLPADKVAVMESLVERYGTVAMVGDGVNDAPAMARASLGIAMGAIGSDAATEAADIALMSDDLRQLPWLIAHSGRTVSIVRQNIVLSLAVKFMFVALALAGHATLWAAIAADMGVSLLVIFNGLRLLNSTSQPGT